MGDKFLNVSAFRQMCGRAGRMGLDAKVRTVVYKYANYFHC
jgi:superfamily II helicase